ncbi:MAG: hypothetical protein WAU24_00965 [Chitinophagaceae bacterium]
MLHKKNIYFLFASIIVLAAFYLYNPFALYFQSDDFLHIKWSSEGIIFQDNAFRPVCDLSVMLDYILFGKNAWGYHLTNLLLHCITSLLVGIVCTIILKKYFKNISQGFFPSITCGILFFMYASHSEAVFWILGRSAILGTLFSLLFLIGFFQKEKHPTFIFLYIISWVLALLSYESCWVLPVIVFLITWPEKEKNKWIHVSIVFIIFIVYLFVRYFFIHQLLGIYEADSLFSGDWKILSQHFMLLISRSFLPWYSENVIAFYGLIALAIILVFFFLSLQKALKKKVVFVFTCFLVSLLPYISLGIDTNGVEGERFLYLPIMLLSIFIVLVVYAAAIKKFYKEIWLLIFCVFQIMILQENSANQQFAGNIVKTVLHKISMVDPSNKIMVKGLPQCQYGALIFRAGLPEATGWLINKEQEKNIEIVSQRSEVLPLAKNYKVEYVRVPTTGTYLFNFKDSSLQISGNVFSSK